MLGIKYAYAIIVFVSSSMPMSVCYYTMLLVMFVHVSVLVRIVYLVMPTSLFVFMSELHGNVMTMIVVLPISYYYFHTRFTLLFC